MSTTTTAPAKNDKCGCGHKFKSHNRGAAVWSAVCFVDRCDCSRFVPVPKPVAVPAPLDVPDGLMLSWDEMMLTDSDLAWQWSEESLDAALRIRPGKRKEVEK